MGITSPRESTYTGLKDWLRNGKANIVTFLQKMGLSNNNHLHRYDSALARLNNSAPNQFTHGIH